MKMKEDQKNTKLFKHYYIIVPFMSFELPLTSDFINKHSWFIENGGKILFKVGGFIENNLQSNLKKNKSIILYEKKDFSIYNAWNQSLDVLDSLNINKNSYVIFLGLDDILKEDYLRKACDVVENSNKFDFLYGDFQSVLGNYHRNFKSKSNPNIFKKNNFSFDIPHPGLLNNWNLIRDYRFNEDYKLAADFDFYLRISLKKNVNFKYIPLIQATLGANGISNSYKAKSIYLKEWHEISLKNKVDLDLDLRRSRIINLLSRFPLLFSFFRNLYWKLVATKNKSNEKV
jgi:hypothetical protein